MNLELNDFLRAPLVEALGWTLIHFVWQGAAIAILLWLALKAMTRASANARYTAGCLALLIMVFTPVGTFKSMLDAQSRDSQDAVGLWPVPDTEATAEPSPGDRGAVVRVEWNKSSISVTSFREWINPALPWLVVGWFGAVVVLSIRLGLGWWQLRRIRKESQEPLDPRWETVLDRMLRDLKLRRPVMLCKSALVEVPTVIGWLKPVVFFPTTALTGLTPEQLEMVLAHELAHVRRHDYLINLGQSVMETLLFYHPGVWWVSRQVRNERELCCDEMAVQLCGDRLTYARALAALEELRAVPLRLGVAAGSGSLVERIRRLIGLRPEPTHSSWWVVSGLVFTLIWVVGVATQSLRPVLAQSSSVTSTRMDGLLFAIVEADPQNPGNERVIPIAPRLGECIQAAKLQQSIDGRPEIFIEFNPEGARLFAKITESHVNQQLAIIFNGRTLTKPIIREKISGGRIMISGKLTAREAGEIVDALNREKAVDVSSQPELRAAHETISANEPALTAEPTTAKPGASTAPVLLTRTFKVDPNTFIEAVTKTLPKDKPLAEFKDPQAVVRAFFSAVGIEFKPAETGSTNQQQRALHFNDRSGLIFVRATAMELDVIEKALQVVNQSPAQVTIETKFVEIIGADTKALGLDWFIAATNASAAGNQPVTVTGLQSDPQFAGLKPNLTRIVGTASGVLTQEQYREAIKKFGQTPGIDMLAAPKVTTLSGRQARIEVSEMKAIVSTQRNGTADSTRSSNSTSPYEVANVPVGPSLDVTPFVSADGKSIRMDLAAKVVEFLGYDDPGPTKTRGSLQHTPAVPRFRIREAATSASILDGQTIVLSGMPVDDVVLIKDKVPVLGDLPFLGRLFRHEGKSIIKKHLLVFVTPTVVDAAGNRVEHR